LVFLYNIFIYLYTGIIRISSIWNKKAELWVKGRKDWHENLTGKINKEDKIIWVHCSSAGELEQGKPIIEKLKAGYPDHKILITVFSPSGYGPAFKFQHADIVAYLPVDTRTNADAFIKLVNPKMGIFIKYEFWYHHLASAAFHHIPLLLVSAVFRKEQIFFKKYGGFYRQMLFFFRQILVQDNSSLELLRGIGIDHCSLSGDTRFDRVIEIANDFKDVPVIRQFAGNNKIIVAGSTWYEDEKALANLDLSNNSKLVIAPHDINEKRIHQIEELFANSCRYSKWNSESVNKKVLIIDNFGMLSKLYHYATVAYVGGGFTRDGIHNILEAAVYNKPVVFGPNYSKYREAKEMIFVKGAFSFKNNEELKAIMNRLLNDNIINKEAAISAGDYVNNNTGATNKIMEYVQANRLLTS
jgi:3-deoxy-D-manno-octulosonic-acid transferase